MAGRRAPPVHRRGGDDEYHGAHRGGGDHATAHGDDLAGRHARRGPVPLAGVGAAGQRTPDRDRRGVGGSQERPAARGVGDRDGGRGLARR